MPAMRALFMLALVAFLAVAGPAAATPPAASAASVKVGVNLNYTGVLRSTLQQYCVFRQKEGEAPYQGEDPSYWEGSAGSESEAYGFVSKEYKRRTGKTVNFHVTLELGTNRCMNDPPSHVKADRHHFGYGAFLRATWASYCKGSGREGELYRGRTEQSLAVIDRFSRLYRRAIIAKLRHTHGAKRIVLKQMLRHVLTAKKAKSKCAASPLQEGFKPPAKGEKGYDCSHPYVLRNWGGSSDGDGFFITLSKGDVEYDASSSTYHWSWAPKRGTIICSAEHEQVDGEYWVDKNPDGGSRVVVYDRDNKHIPVLKVTAAFHE